MSPPRGVTVRSIADDLGIERGTLRKWLDLHGTGKKTAADGTTTRGPLNPVSTSPARAAGRPGAGGGPVGPETPEQRIARLEAENAALRVEATKLVTEREILRKAAKYFAGETRW